MTLASAVALLIGFASNTVAQASISSTSDVASVKQNILGVNDIRGINEGPGHGPENINRTPTSLSMENVRLSSALKWAYQLQDFQISGPQWIQSDRYDIFAKMATPVSPGELRRKLQNLLADRFKLVSHHDTKVLPAFELTTGKDGPKLGEAVGDGDGRITAVGKPEPGFTLSFMSTSIDELADRVSGSMGAPVADMSGLKGRYNFALDISRYLHGGPLNPDDIRSVVSQAVQDQLGLRLTPKKLPLDVLIIDHVEKVPTAN
jgi:uncharacterized protein (TIGR03435 family)